jgi:hypothetical protein
MFRVRFAVLILCVLAGLASFSYAQTEPKAYKFAEFGPITAAGMKRKMLDFRAKLKEDPSSQGYII